MTTENVTVAAPTHWRENYSKGTMKGSDLSSKNEHSLCILERGKNSEEKLIQNDVPNLIYTNQKEKEQVVNILALSVICRAITVTKHKEYWRP